LKRYFAPDWSREIYTGQDEENQFVWKIADLSQGNVLGILDITPPIAWQHDASRFVATITDNADIPAYSIELFNQQGQPIETIFTVPDGQQLGLFTLGWSIDDRYFAFIAFNMYVENNKAYPSSYYHRPDNILYIVDTQNRLIVDTCTAIGEGLAWSPDTSIPEITFLAPGEGSKDVFILDMNSYKLHRIARHSVGYNRRIYQGSHSASDGIIGWRSD
jgi:hypothetical protein